MYNTRYQANRGNAYDIITANRNKVAQRYHTHPYPYPQHMQMPNFQQMDPRPKTLEEYTNSLPSCLRGRFRDIYNTLTQGIPNHQESAGCPLSLQEEKRTAFQQAAPNKISQEQLRAISKAVVTACKQHNLCAKCGRTRTPQTERFHRFCRADARNCPPHKTPDCFNHTCNHPLHQHPSLWRTDEFIIKCKFSDNPVAKYTPFC